jgi:hypothetical protein
MPKLGHTIRTAIPRSDPPAAETFRHKMASATGRQKREAARLSLESELAHLTAAARKDRRNGSPPNPFLLTAKIEAKRRLLGRRSFAEIVAEAQELADQMREGRS